MSGDLRLRHLMLPESARRLCAALVLAEWTVRPVTSGDGSIELHAVGERGFDLVIVLVPKLTATGHRGVYACQVRLADRTINQRRALELILNNPVQAAGGRS